MKPETLQKIREMAEEKFPIPYTMGVIDAALSHGYRKIFVQAAEAALSTPELLEGEGWRKDEWISVNVPPKANEVYECYIRDYNEYVFAKWVVPEDRRKGCYWQDTMTGDVVFSITHYKTKTPPPSE